MSSWGSPSQEERGHPDRQPRHRGVGGGGVEGQSAPNYDELLPLVARGKLNPARLVTRQIALGT